MRDPLKLFRLNYSTEKFLLKFISNSEDTLKRLFEELRQAKPYRHIRTFSRIIQSREKQANIFFDGLKQLPSSQS